MYVCALHAVELALTPGNPVTEGCAHCPVLSSPAQLLQTHAHGFSNGASPSHIWLSTFPSMSRVGQKKLTYFCPTLYIHTHAHTYMCVYVYSCPSVSAGDWFQAFPQVPKSMDAQVPNIK